MKNIVDEKQCPFCEQANNCMAHSDTPCWCVDVVIPTALQELVPPVLKRKTCICLSCIEQYQKDPVAFTKKHASN